MLCINYYGFTFYIRAFSVLILHVLALILDFLDKMTPKQRRCDETQSFHHSFSAYQDLIEIAVQHIVKSQNNKYTASNAENISIPISCNNFVSISVQLHCHRNFQKTHYPKISVQSPGSNRASASRL